MRTVLIEELRRLTEFSWYAWLLTDPVTEVGGAPLADVPSLPDLPRLIRSKYLTTLNRWTTLDAGAVSLHTASGGTLSRSRLWRDALSGHGIVDVASLVFRDTNGCWGWLDLWRTQRMTPFTPSEVSLLAEVVGPVTTALRQAQGRTFSAAVPPPMHRGPAVLILSPELTVSAQTHATEQYLRTLVPPEGDRPPIPAGAYNVAAQLLAVEEGLDEHPPSTRVHLGDGVWVTLRAARAGAGGSPDEHDIAVTIEQCSPSERRDLFVRSHGLSVREGELIEHLSQGSDTRAIARTMFLSEHTVQDHLKSIFAKTGTHSRRTLLARLVGP